MTGLLVTNSLVFFSSSEDALISSSFLKDIFILEGDLKKCIVSFLLASMFLIRNPLSFKLFCPPGKVLFSHCFQFLNLFLPFRSLIMMYLDIVFFGLIMSDVLSISGICRSIYLASLGSFQSFQLFPLSLLLWGENDTSFRLFVILP